MSFIKEETEEIRISEPFRVKHEETEEQKGWFSNVNSEPIVFLIKMLTIEQINDRFEKSYGQYEESSNMSTTIKAD